MPGKEELKQIFEEKKISDIWPFVEPHLAQAIKMEILQKDADEKDFKLGESKLGGYPHLPPHIKWDDIRYKFEKEQDIHLSFILQLNFEDVSKYDETDLLPKKGMLYFFSVHGDRYVNNLGEIGHLMNKLPHINDNCFIFLENTDNLMMQSPKFAPTEEEFMYYSKELPKGFEPNNPKPFYEDRIFPACKLKFSKILSLPSRAYLQEIYLDNPDFPPSEHPGCWRNYYKLRGTRYHGHMEILGYGGEAYQGEDYDKFDAGVDAHRQLLFQLDSLNGMNWRNCQGSILFFIPTEDLLNKEFSNIDICEDF